MDRNHLCACSTLLVSIVLAWNTPLAQADEPVTLDTDPNLAAWWKFDETSGTTAADASKHGRNAALKGELSEPPQVSCWAA